MKDLVKKLFKRAGNSDSRSEPMRVKDINQATNAVFEKYKKSFKDLARYDREGKVPAN
jgi:hypothetical protein